jgi:hypothetical protein
MTMWIIDKDNGFNPEFDKKSRAGYVSRDYEPAREKDLTQQFRMYDDDGVLCYEGRSTDSESEDAFRPLDELGTPDAGCTEIRYLRGGDWETL